MSHLPRNVEQERLKSVQCLGESRFGRLARLELKPHVPKSPGLLNWEQPKYALSRLMLCGFEFGLRNAARMDGCITSTVERWC
jgi:hypothetical protein